MEAKTKTVYVSSDGVEFSEKEDCRQHEQTQAVAKLLEDHEFIVSESRSRNDEARQDAALIIVKYWDQFVKTMSDNDGRAVPS